MKELIEKAIKNGFLEEYFPKTFSDMKIIIYASGTDREE